MQVVPIIFMNKQRTNWIKTTLGSFNFFSPTHPPPAGDREANLGLVLLNIVKSLEQRDFTIFFLYATEFLAMEDTLARTSGWWSTNHRRLSIKQSL
jgi:hypothetical protein